MNLKRSAWLPPDGDSRLVRFQQDLSAWGGWSEQPALPPHLELLVGEGRPAGFVGTGGWVLREGEPVVEGFDSLGTVGVFHFGFPSGQPWVLETLPPPPALTWTKGTTAVLAAEWPQDPSFVLWSWESRRGWKGGPPKV